LKCAGVAFDDLAFVWVAAMSAVALMR